MIPGGAFDWWDHAMEVARFRASLRGERQAVRAVDGGRAWVIVPTTARCQQIGGQETRGRG